MDTTTLDQALTRAMSNHKPARSQPAIEQSETISPATLIESTPTRVEPLNINESQMLEQLSALETAATDRSSSLSELYESLDAQVAALQSTRAAEREAIATAMRNSPTGIWREDELARFDAITASMVDELGSNPAVGRGEVAARETANRLRGYSRRMVSSTEPADAGLDSTLQEQVANRLGIVTAEIEALRPAALVDRIRSAIHRDDRPMLEAYSLVLPQKIKTEEGGPHIATLQSLVGRINDGRKPAKQTEANKRAVKALGQANRVLDTIEERRTRGQPPAFEEAYSKRFGSGRVKISTGELAGSSR